MKSILRGSLLAILAATTMLGACAKHDDKNAGGGSANSQSSIDNSVEAVTITSEQSNASHVLQITAINFLMGGVQLCDVRNQLFAFRSNDNNLRTSICKNSAVEVVANSNLGNVVFSAVDLASGSVLSESPNSTGNTVILGSTEGMVRYEPVNPYGYTYVMAEEVTNIDPALLGRWNELQGRLSALRAQVLTAQRQGQVVPQAVLNQLAEGEAVEVDLARQIRASTQGRSDQETK